MFSNDHPEKVKLTGFNNLNKTLCFNFYDFAVATDDAQKEAYIDYIHEHYSASRISHLLQKIVHLVGANVLDISEQDYEPFGASAMVLMSDVKGGGENPLDAASTVHMHLDKSHVCAHTYPDFTEPNGIVSFRVDIDISTCGDISPLTALNAIFDFFDTDVVTIDYVVRGFTRDTQGRRVYIDHTVNSIRDYIDPAILKSYRYKDLILQNDNIWQLKLLRTDMDEDEYFSPEWDPAPGEKAHYLNLVRQEMTGLFHNWRE